MRKAMLLLSLTLVILCGCGGGKSSEPGKVEVRSTEELGKVGISTAPAPIKPK
ncbi:MAG: hypothetical protein NZM31_02555 [Gemmatales bacterium]|nr:hypothetical protein [Gemmatales bacterium]MDW8385880.1 hypothetical protein [Gemmatales bacterium]